MSTPILATKLFIPPLRPNIISRPRLIAQLNAGLHRKLTLISASAGFGKTTLVTEWIRQKDDGGKRKAKKDDIHPSSFIPHPSNVAWLALDEGDSDRSRFLAYFIAALQTIAPGIGSGVLGALQSPPSLIFQPLIEPLSQRELEILRLVAQGLSNKEIGERLFLALSTVKGHNRNIYSKLQVQRRTEAVARARELSLI